MRALQCLSLAFLFLVNAVPSKAQEGAAEARVVVREGAPLTVECGLRVEQRAEWRRDGGAVPADMRAGEVPAGGRVAARLHVAAARPHHAGLYSCGRESTQRVRVLVEPVPAAAAPSVTDTTTQAAPAPAASADEPDIVLELVKFELGSKFSLNCTEAESVKPDKIIWFKNGTQLEKVTELKGRYELDKTVFKMTARSNEDDFGNYTCGVRDVTGVANGWELHARPHAKLPDNTNVVEGQKLKLTCKLIGKPYPPVSWTYSNDSSNATEVTVALGDRVRLERSDQGVEFGQLVVEAAERADAGVFTCVPRDGANDTTTLRVKDMYAALWPFLGICIEVFILCAIILVYEKRRTKPELDDSDTDNHDQKKS